MRAAQGPPGPFGPTLTAEWIPVRVLGAQDGRTAVQAIADPLEPGQRVVVVGLDLAFPGTTLMARGEGGPPPGAGPPGGPPGSKDAGAEGDAGEPAPGDRP